MVLESVGETARKPDAEMAPVATSWMNTSLVPSWTPRRTTPESVAKTMRSASPSPSVSTATSYSLAAALDQRSHVLRAKTTTGAPPTCMVWAPAARRS